MNRLTGKTALITGASRGIGRAIALRLAAEGALVVLHYGKNRSAAEAVAREIEQQGGTALLLGADFRSVRGIPEMYEALDGLLQNQTGGPGLDILVNNAGVGLSLPIEATTEDAFDEVMNVNVKAPFFVIQQALPRLRDGGRIINISSATTRISLPVIPAYSMSKGAINTLTLNLSTQLGSRGITINAIMPGFVETEMNAETLQTPEGREFGANFSIFKRWGQPEDVADIAAFLASDDSRWITGQLLDASGGTHL